MQIKYINVRGAKFLERRGERDLERLGVIAYIVDFDGILGRGGVQFVVARVLSSDVRAKEPGGYQGMGVGVWSSNLCGNNYMISISSLFHPFANPLLRNLVLTIRMEEITAVRLKS